MGAHSFFFTFAKVRAAATCRKVRKRRKPDNAFPCLRAKAARSPLASPQLVAWTPYYPHVDVTHPRMRKLSCRFRPLFIRLFERRPRSGAMQRSVKRTALAAEARTAERRFSLQARKTVCFVNSICSRSMRGTLKRSSRPSSTFSVDSVLSGSAGVWIPQLPDLRRPWRCTRPRPFSGVERPRRQRKNG